MHPYIKERRFLPQSKKSWLLLLVGAGAVLTAGIFIFVVVLASTLPSVEEIDSHEIAQSTRIYDRTGENLLYEISAGKRRLVVPEGQVPQSLKDATLAIEDQNFYNEPAFNWKGIARAFVQNLIHGQIVQGGSTITQQLARNAFLSTEQTWTRKVRELLLAIQLSQHYSKDKILWLYLNEIPYGSTIYGAGTASEAYFNKPVDQLSIAESAILASIPKAPPYYSPWGSHIAALLARQHLVLKAMLDQKRITQAQYDEAVSEKLAFQPQNNGIQAPHFVLAVQDYLEEKYGEDMVRTGGLSVITTLDMNLQTLAEKTVEAGAERNTQLYDGENAALVAEDPKTGQILALTGSRNYFATSSLPAGCTPGSNCKFEPNFDVATQGLRQPGSALKPFVYMTDFEKGYTPDTILFDVPTEFVPNDPACPPVPDFNAEKAPECFHPQDFEGTFAGPMSMRNALAQSVNVPAVKALYLAGLPNVLKTLSDFGITTLTDPKRYGLSLVLGGGEVHLMDLIKAYSTLSQEGVRHEQSLVLEVRDASGKVLETYEDQATRVIDPEYPRLVNDVLSDPTARAGLFQASLNLTVFPDHDVALKTGTTNDYRDAWAMGYTPSLAVGVWAGNNDNTAMKRNGSSILAAVPMWHDFLLEALKNMPTETFTRPDPQTPTKPVLGGQYVIDNQVHSILYYVDKSDPTGNPPADPNQDPQFADWETGVLTWVSQNFSSIQFNSSSTFPGATGTAQVSISSPQPGSFADGPITVSANLTAAATITRIRVYWNGQTVQETNGQFPSLYQYSSLFSPADIQPQNLLEVEMTDANNQTNKSGVIVYGH